MSACTKGIETIDSILEPDSDAFSALTDSQIEGLESIKKMLTTFHEEKQTMHIPLELMKEYEKEEETECTDYIVQSFGGVQQKKRSMKTIVQKTITMNRFVKGLKTHSISNVIDGSGFCEQMFPYEWYKLPETNRKRLRQMLSWENLAKWDFNVIELNEITNGHPLLFVGWALLASPTAEYAMAYECGENPESVDQFKGYGFPATFHYSIPKLCFFLRSISADYNDVPYHNKIHAADVTQTLHSILEMGGKVYADEIQIFALLIAALGHDVNHPGRNNNYQISARSKFALLYNDKSCLENMHAALLFKRLLGEEKEDHVNILSKVSDAQMAVIRKIIVDAILHTDMSLHFVLLNEVSGSIASTETEGKEDEAASSKDFTSEAKEQLLWFFLHAADISNPAKASPMFTFWTDRMLEEFFAQGDEEKENNLPISPLCNRDTTAKEQSQIGFIKFVVKPTYEVLGKAIGNVKKDVLPVVDQNHDYWQTELKKDAI